ncbi:MAG: 4Fe-4S cluster-binding domain-containing protein [Ruminiclostridium sp.]|nr:4Fe-4S cluster-binding domain-containing protein [Ruminiclostridium sp.]
MTDIYGLTYEKLKTRLSEIGEKPSRADIIFPAIYGEPPVPLSELPLKKETLEKLSGIFFTGELECIRVQSSETADKYLFALNDDNTIESVLMKHEFGYNVCVSTQVGCNMGCAFCMSGKLKKRRDLTVSEMTEQLLAIRKISEKKITGISIMGIGEPLENLTNVLDFIGAGETNRNAKSLSTTSTTTTKWR